MASRWEQTLMAKSWESSEWVVLAKLSQGELVRSTWRSSITIDPDYQLKVDCSKTLVVMEKKNNIYIFLILATVEEKYNATYVDFDTLLKTSDVISVSVPLSKETTHLLSKQEFSICKHGVIVVNTSRGKVIDEAALVSALESGRVAAVGLDVFEEVNYLSTRAFDIERHANLTLVGLYNRNPKFILVCSSIREPHCCHMLAPTPLKPS